MATLEALIFDFDGVVADCRRSMLLPGAASFIRDAAERVPLGIAPHAELVVSGLAALTLDMLVTLVTTET